MAGREAGEGFRRTSATGTPLRAVRSQIAAHRRWPCSASGGVGPERVLECPYGLLDLLTERRAVGTEAARMVLAVRVEATISTETKLTLVSCQPVVASDRPGQEPPADLERAGIRIPRLAQGAEALSTAVSPGPSAHRELAHRQAGASRQVLEGLSITWRIAAPHKARGASGEVLFEAEQEPVISGAARQQQRPLGGVRRKAA